MHTSLTRAFSSSCSVMVSVASGSGKSLCYQLPPLILGGLCLVISPLLALIDDQIAALKECDACGKERRQRARSNESDLLTTWMRATRVDLSLGLAISRCPPLQTAH